MPNINEESNHKIDAFQDSVKKDAESEIAALISRAEQEKEQLINTVKDESLSFSFYKISAETKLIKTACKKSVSKQSFESRRAVLKKRGELVDNFFVKLSAELLRFAESAEYIPFIEKEIKEIESFLSFYDEVRIFVKPSDFENKKLFDKYKDKLCADKKIKIGGIAVFFPVERIYIDRTLDKKLKTERGDFINHKELQL